MTLGRRFWVVVHRWAGLSIALFMVIVGVTGAIIPWQTELQRLIAPDRFVAAPSPDARPLPVLELWRIAEARTGGVIDYLPIHREPGDAATFGVVAKPGAPALGFDEILLDPFTGRELVRDRAANLADGAAQIIPFLYRLHFELALGDWGAWTLGIAALVWTLDCFVGFYLTLPIARPRWWRHWGKSWRLRWRAGGYRLNFDLHRAGSLWVWPMLLVFAWSSVGMNLRQVYDPVMRTLTGERPVQSIPPSREPNVRRLDMEQALAAARLAVSRETARRELHVERERVLSFDRASNTYYLAVRTERDLSDDGANSYFTIDAADGHLMLVALPTGVHSGGTIDYWIGQLHVAGVFGLPYRVFVSALGLFLAVISVTGVVIRMRKRSARLLAGTRRRRARAARIAAAAT